MVRPGRPAPLALAVGAALLVGAAGPVAGQVTPPGAAGSGDRLLVELRVEGGPRGLVPGLFTGGDLLLDLPSALALTGIEVQATPVGGALRAVQHPEELALVVDPGAGVLRRGSEEVGLRSDQAFWLDETLFLSVPFLEILLDVRASADVAGQLVLLRGGEHLPAVREAERRRRADRVALDPGGVGAERMVAASDPTRFGGLAVDWNLDFGTFTSTTVQDFSSEFRGARAAVGAEVLGGSLNLLHRVNGGARSITGSDRTEVSWFRAWPRNRWLRQLRLGDVPGTGPFGRFFRGASVSNVPFVRPTRFASNVVGGDVPAGWEVELYRGEQLLDRGMVGPDGEIEFRAPTQFGFNPYRLLAYGPNGQRAELDRAFFVFNERLPAGQFEYSLGGGECRYALCEATANVDLRWGVSDRLTVRGGAVSLWYDSIPDRQALYGSATVQPTRALSLTGNLVEGTLGEAVVRVYPSRDLQIDGGYTYLQAGSPDPRRYRESDAEIVRGSITYRPRALGYLTTFRAFGSLEDRGAATRRGWGASVASQIARVRVDLGGQRTSLDPASAGRRVVHRGYAQSSVQLRRGSRGLLAGSILRGGVTAVERRGLESAFVRFSQPFGRQWRVAAQVGWDEFRGTSLRIDVKANLRGLRWNSRNEVLEGGAQGVQTLQGSVLLGAAARPISLADGYAVGRAGVTGVAFQDLDGDGRRDQGEPAISGVRVRLQGRLETTDLSGAFSVWDLAPFEEVRLRVDPTAGPDLQWTPLHEVYQVFPEPNRFTQVDIPFIRTVEVLGEVRLQPGDRAVGGIDVLLVPLDPAMREVGTVYRSTTFSDGGFYFMGVAPGDYRIRILQPGLPDDAGGVDAGVLEVRSGESGVLDGIVLTIGAGDLDRLEEELSDYLDSDRIQQAFGELDPDELRRAVVGRQLRAGGGSESVRWVPLDRGAAPAATEPTRTTAGAGGG